MTEHLLRHRDGVHLRLEQVSVHETAHFRSALCHANERLIRSEAHLLLDVISQLFEADGLVGSCVKSADEGEHLTLRQEHVVLLEESLQIHLV